MARKGGSHRKRIKKGGRGTVGQEILSQEDVKKFRDGIDKAATEEAPQEKGAAGEHGTVQSDAPVETPENCGHRVVCPKCGYIYEGTACTVTKCPNDGEAVEVKGRCGYCERGSLPIPEGFERVQLLVPELGKLFWDKGFLFLGVAIPYELLTDEAKIKENGSPLYVDLTAAIMHMENFSGLGVTGVARLKVALLMHVIEALQSEVITDLKTTQTLDSMNVKNRDKN